MVTKMKHYKYLYTEERKHGMIWVINPPRSVRNDLGVGYEKYYTLVDGRRRSEELMQAVEDHKRRKARTKKMHIPPNTVDALWAWYTQHKSYKTLTDNSKRTYAQIYKSISGTYLKGSDTRVGLLLTRTVDSEVADKIHAHIEKHHSEHAANSAVKVLRRMFYVGRRGPLPNNRANPFQQMGLRQLISRRVRWTDEDVEKFIMTADKMGFWSVGTLLLMCYDLCQRPGDMRPLTWCKFNDGVFKFVQEKTRRKNPHPIVLDASERLISRLSEIPRGDADDIIIKYEATGRPYDKRMYAKIAARVRAQAGLNKELQIRDARRSGATLLAEFGCTEDEIASVTGHTSRDMLRVYVNPTQKTASRAMQKRFSNG